MTGAHDLTDASFGPLGADGIVVPAFFATEDNAAELLEWQGEHPDWFEAGTWSGGSRRPGGDGAIGQRQHGRTPTPGLRAPDDYAVIALPVALPDLSTLSVRSFEDAAAATRAAPHAEAVQFNPPPSPNTRMPGGGFRSRTTAEEFREFRFNSALESIRRLEPHNRDLAYLRDPNRTPAEDQVRALEHEAEMARLRSKRELPAEPAEKKGPQPAEAPRSTFDIVVPGGSFIGYREGRAGEEVKTVSPTKFEILAHELLIGARPTPNLRYLGEWFTRSDGSSFGFRMSKNNGLTIDINDPKLPLGFRVHQKNE